ncbi:MAG: universal stress protein [Actinocatenispora sp.]
MSTAQQEPRIVVGLDGSQPSKQALRWAARQAQLMHAQLEVITTWDVPALYGWTGSEDLREMEDAARTVVTDSIEEVLGADAGPYLSARVVQGNAARVLIDASRRASLLVVGSRGHGGFTEALLGSVGQHVTQHAHCPVLITRGPDQGDG